MLLRCAQTSLNSKLLSHYKDFFSELVVEAVETLDTNLLDKDLIGIKLVTGGSITVRQQQNKQWEFPNNNIIFLEQKESQLVKGVGFKKTFSYAGFE